MKARAHQLTYLVLGAALAACTSSGNGGGGGGGGSGDPPLGGANQVTGTVVDFQTRQPIGVTPDLSALGLVAPMISVSGSSFTIDDVPDNSLFQLLASAPPTYASTYSPAVTTTVGPLSGVTAYAVSESFISTTATGYSLSPDASKGILLIQLVDGSGAPKSGVAGSNIVLSGITGASGPHFLDANLAATTATQSSSSGWVVFFNVPAGSVTLAPAANATMTLDMAQSPIAAQTVTVATAKVTAGAPTPPPTNVSFSTQVYPIFTSRGCVECHSGNKIGANLGDLSLDGGVNHVYGQLVTTAHPERVQVMMPSKSEVLTKPSYSNPSNGHPVVVFTGPTDRDYETILAWITEGAKNN